MATSLDVLIKNTTIVDGTGRPRYNGDIGIAAGKVAAIGQVAGEAEQAGNPENQQRGRERQEVRKPGRLGTEPGMRGIAEDLGRVEG